MNLADRQQVSLTYNVAQRDCSSNDSIEIELVGSGGMGGYTYYLDGEQISSTYKSDTAGVFTITVQDALGCEREARKVGRHATQRAPLPQSSIADS